MKYIELVTSANSFEAVEKIAHNVKAKDFRYDPKDEDGMQLFRMIVIDDALQEALDSFSQIMGAHPTAKVVVIPVEAYLPKEKEGEEEKKKQVTAAREAIYETVEKSAHINGNYFVLVTLSTIVATIGLIENNVAVVIGAMVIAPLLGPNIALSFATSLGDTKLMLSSIKTIFAGIVIAIVLPVVMGVVLHPSLHSNELLARTYVGFDSVVLALASGAAAALSITTGLSSVLVGVMVAVALLPPAATFGLMLGSGNISLASNAGVLLAVNIVSINLASKVVFLVKGITPRTWFEKEKAKKAMRRYITAWVVTLLILLLFIYSHPAA